MRISLKHSIKEYLDLYLEITRLYTPLFFQKSTLLRCVPSAFRICSYCYTSLFFTHFPGYMKNMFSLRSSSYDLRGNYILSLSKSKTTTVLTPFLTFQLNSGMHCLTFFVLVFLQTLRLKCRVLPLRKFFLLEHTYT